MQPESTIKSTTWSSHKSDGGFRAGVALSPPLAYNINTMQKDDLREIGRRLFAEMPRIRLSLDMKTAAGMGAGGDMTFGVDKIAEEIILESLERLHEPFTVISEEAGISELNGGGARVVVDPVDGSKNAVSGIPFYCASIAVAEGGGIGDVVLAYVINLISGDEFWAEKGTGAYMNGNRIRCQQGQEFELAAYEAQLPRRDIPSILPVLAESRKTRCLGATALDLSCLAMGAVSIFLSPSPSRSFDFAGGYLLVKEAGGVFTDMEGGPVEDIPLGLERSRPLLASGNERLHGKALRLLSGG